MKIATPEELAHFLRTDKEALLADWEAEVRRLPAEKMLTRPVLLDHVPALVEELIHDLEILAIAQQTAKVSRIHGEQRQVTGLSIRHVVEEYKLLRSCIIQRLERAGWVIGAQASQLLHRGVDEAIKAAVAAYTAQRDQEDRGRREEYLSFIVHDLRSPLTAIYHAMILHEQRLTAERTEEHGVPIVDVVKRNIEHMQGLIVKLLQAEQNMQMAPTFELLRSTSSLHTLVQAAIDTLSPIARNNQTTVVNGVARDIVIEGDEELLRRALQNVISNAIDHTRNGMVAIEALSADDKVECCVRDDGDGIAADELPKVFDKFQTSGRRRGGMGLGLAVVKRIIEAHGGSVTLESRVGDGTTVRLVLPRAAAGERTAEATTGGS